MKKKTMCIIFNAKKDKHNYLPILLNNKQLNYCKQIKYLGHNIDSELNDNNDIMRQVGAIYARGNMLINKFRDCNENNKCKLFKTYISNFYASHKWCNYSVNIYNKFRVAYNKIFRSLFSLDRRCSVSSEMTKRNIDTCAIVQRKYVYSIYRRVNSQENVLLNDVINSDVMLKSKLVTK